VIRWMRAKWLGMMLGMCAAAATSANAQAPAQGSVGSATSGQAAPAVGAHVDLDNSYRFGTADRVRIIVFNEPTLSGEFNVNSDGNLSLPLIGNVKASGRTPNEVISDVQSKLADGYLREPRVSLDVLTYRPFYIMGEVNKPGEYPYSNGLTVMNAVARAEGFTYRANRNHVFIKRAGKTTEQDFNLRKEDPGVQPGDTVRIGERYF
jgi:protein involved in polysaccharide export with SLBB domain